LPLTLPLPDSSSGQILSSGSITGIIIGLLALLAVIGLIIVLLRKRSPEEEEGIEKDDGVFSLGYSTENEFESAATEFFAELTLDNPIADEPGAFGAFVDVFNIQNDEAILAF
jgi:hypothetical protein